MGTHTGCKLSPAGGNLANLRCRCGQGPRRAASKIAELPKANEELSLQVPGGSNIQNHLGWLQMWHMLPRSMASHPKRFLRATLPDDGSKVFQANWATGIMASTNSANHLMTNKTLAVEAAQQRYIDALEKRISVLELQVQQAPLTSSAAGPEPEPKSSTNSPSPPVPGTSVGYILPQKRRVSSKAANIRHRRATQPAKRARAAPRARARARTGPQGLSKLSHPFRLIPSSSVK